VVKNVGARSEIMAHSIMASPRGARIKGVKNNQ